MGSKLKTIFACAGHDVMILPGDLSGKVIERCLRLMNTQNITLFLSHYGSPIIPNCLRYSSPTQCTRVKRGQSWLAGSSDLRNRMDKKAIK